MYNYIDYEASGDVDFYRGKRERKKYIFPPLRIE